MRIILTILLIFCFIPLASAGPVTQYGYGYTPVTKTYSSSTDQSSTTVWDPASNKRIILLGVVFSSNTNANFSLAEDDGTTVIPTVYNTASGIQVIGNGTPIWKGSADTTLDLTTTGQYTNTATSILLWGYEE